MTTFPRVAALACAAVFALGAGAAQAGPTLTLAAEARARVANDEMTVTLAVERDGAQPGPPNDLVNRELADAIERARKVPGVQARLGQFWTQPVFGAQGKITGYRVRGELALESRNVAELGQLTGVLGARMQVAGIGFRVSAQRRDIERDRLLKEAADAFRAKAHAAAGALGYREYEIRTVTLQDGQASQPRFQAQPMAMADGVRASPAPLPVEAGDSEISVGMSGSVELR